MTEFSTGASLELTVPDRELRAARQQIEEEIGETPISVSVDVESSGAGASSVNRRSRENAMARQLMSTSNDYLEDVSKYGEENLQLNQTRNELLQELVDESEVAGGSGNIGLPRPRNPGGGGGGGLGGAGLAGAAMLGTAMLGLTSALTGFEIEVPDIPPLEVPKIPPVTIKKPDWLPLPVATPTGTGPGTGTGTGTGGSGVTIPGTGTPGVSPRDHGVPSGGGSPSPGPSGMNLPLPDPDTLWKVGVTGGAGYLAKDSIKSGLRGILGSGSAGAGFPVLTPEMLPEGNPLGTNPMTGKDLPPSILQEEGREKRLGPAWDWVEGKTQLGGKSETESGWNTDTRKNQARERKQQKTTVNYEPTFEVNLRELKRMIRKDVKEVERRVKNIESELPGGAGGPGSVHQL
ncbi:hypothetical protein [Halorussus sp. AFM4]|uniref:hypothetical protein n=1 Tax=Halorussus sp. AFM4 TaxID=3421651 RepID=UPI003EBD89FA